MEKKTVSAIILTLLLASMLTLAFDIQPVKASGTIYIRADGSVDPSTAPISSVDNVTYTFTGNTSDPIVIERDNIIVDGANCTIHNSGIGVDLFGRSNVTIKNTNIDGSHGYYGGIRLQGSSNNSISGNNITRNSYFGIALYDSSDYNNISANNLTTSSIYLGYSSNNSISGNNITAGVEGIVLAYSSNNSITGSNITHNNHGIYLGPSSNYNDISGNNITNNVYGIGLYASSNYNSISGNNITNNEYQGILLSSDYNNIVGNDITNNRDGILLGPSYKSSISHNNFLNNLQQVYVASSGFTNVWNDGYPSSGNYWSDYSGTDVYSGQFQNETGSDNFGDFPYVIDVNNQDNYPLMRPYVPFENQTIYIRADGSVDPSGAPIQRKGDLYALTDNITSNADGIVIERENIVLDGADFTIQGSGSGAGMGLSNRNYVTITNTNVKGFSYSIYLGGSSNNIISGNNLANNGNGIYLEHSSNFNIISGNKITANNETGIWLYSSSGNSISGNNIIASNEGILLGSSTNNSISGNTIVNNVPGIYLGSSSNCNSISGNKITANNGPGIYLDSSSSNSISENNIANNDYNIFLLYHSSSNRIFHNNFVNNDAQVYSSSDSVNIWDNGCEGNCWSDYNGTDSNGDGIGDTPYAIIANNADNYPLMNVYWNPCDINHDLKVNMKDIGRAARAFNTIPGDAFWNPHADITGTAGLPDGLVDMRDIGLMARHFLETCS